MIKRYLTFKDFRTLGIDKEERLDINAFMEDDIVGGLVILIGQNNAGKSNIIAGLRSLSRKKINEKDHPYNIFNRKLKPELALVVRNGSKKISEYKLNDSGPIMPLIEKDKIESISSQLSDETNNIINMLMTDSFTANYNKLSTETEINRLKKVHEIIAKFSNSKKLPKADLSTLNVYANSYTKKKKLEGINRDILLTAVIEIKAISNRAKNNKIDKAEIKKHKYASLSNPRIIEYLDEREIKPSDLVISKDKLSPRGKTFFNKIYQMLPSDKMADMISVYDTASTGEYNHHARIVGYEEKINKSLLYISNTFNEVYSVDGREQYLFKFRLESEKIIFRIYENGASVSLDSQSTGFRWFFNFFFKIFVNTDYTRGDIIFMDEPGLSLHVSAQIKLRKLIKDFGNKYGITFIISTQSPFLHDVDYLEELRLVTKMNQETSITNNFTSDNNNNFDVINVIGPIAGALSADEFMVLGSNNLTIFVEGVTDYNYLLAFKHLFGYKNITFLPVQGIRSENIITKLKAINKNPIILVDSDYAGMEFKKKCEEKKCMRVISLDEINENFKTIESLFNPEDKKLYNNEKSYNNSVRFKNQMNNFKHDLHKDTLANFQIIFNYLKKFK